MGLNPGAAGFHGDRLGNGVHVLTECMPGVRSVAVGAWVRQGAALDGPGQAGASHLLEHLVFRGTGSRSRRQIARSLESVGGSLNAYTSREHTGYEARVLASYLSRAVDVISDLVRDPRLAEGDLEQEKMVVGEEIAAVEDTPDDLVFELHGERLWRGHPYGRSILGTRDSVAAISRDDLAGLHRDRYVGANLVVAAAGAVQHEEFLGLADEWFGQIEPGSEAPGVPDPPAPEEGIDRVARDASQMHIVLGRTTPGHSHRDRHALILLAAALGGGMSSRLFQRVREELALAYAVFSYQSFYTRGGVSGVYAGTRPGKAPEALDAIRNVYRHIAAEGLPRDELDRVKEQVKGQVMLSQESPGARLHRLAGFALYREPFVTLEELTGRIDSVSNCDIVRVAADVFEPERQYALCLGPH
ncbi:MAG: pitrilysin family protein [Gemmatimonadota bacterium]|nr:pitrilysin family protein [Gemmatimonadota bacterium]